MIKGLLLLDYSLEKEEVEDMEFNFCFYCTISGQIISFNRENNWDSKEDFIAAYECEDIKRRDLEVFLRYIDGMLEEFEKIKLLKLKKI
jgi:hypothetical protein